MMSWAPPRMVPSKTWDIGWKDPWLHLAPGRQAVDSKTSCEGGRSICRWREPHFWQLLCVKDLPKETWQPLGKSGNVPGLGRGTIVYKIKRDCEIGPAKNRQFWRQTLHIIKDPTGYSAYHLLLKLQRTEFSMQIKDLTESTMLYILSTTVLLNLQRTDNFQCK